MSDTLQLQLAATPPRYERRADDVYLTPAPLASALVGSLAQLLPEPHLVVEPSAGGGAFVCAARARWPRARLVAFDIRPEAVAELGRLGAHRTAQLDWLDNIAWARLAEPEPQLVLGNPPFQDAQGHVEAALGRLRLGGHLAFLLRLSMLGGVERARSLWARPGLRYLQPVTPRPSFTGGGSDTADVALFVWQRGYVEHAEVLPPLIWRFGR